MNLERLKMASKIDYKKAYEDLRDTVQLNCNPPDDCNDPAVLKEYMKGCFSQAMRKLVGGPKRR